MASWNPVQALFDVVANLIGFPIDQVRYIVLLALSLPVALLMRHALHPRHTPVALRHLLSLSLGLWMSVTCFGWETLCLVVVVAVSYVFLLTTPAAVVQRYTMAWALVCISAGHLYRLLTDYGGYHLDFTGPLMILVQRVTLVGFAVHDGMARKSSELNDDQKTQKLSQVPSVLEYFSYCTNFLTILAGPCATMHQHLCFMEGTNFSAHGKKHLHEPSSLLPVSTKLLQSLASLAVYCWLAVSFPNERALEQHHSLLHYYGIILLVVLKIKCQFYFIWLLSESINNAAGNGFDGYDDRGNPKWDLLSNINIWKIEFATNVRDYTYYWNLTTGLWLRRVCFDRLKGSRLVSPTLATFLLSALWHGFYPGYYMFLVYGAVLSEAGRKLRRVVRPWFQAAPHLRLLYHVLSCVATRVAVDCGVIVFILLWASYGLTVWSNLYFVPNILALLCAFALPSGKGRNHGNSHPNDAGNSDKNKTD